ncbi:hypothetical protein BRADI_5g15523v3 [Brachypodium distachyon]|uniref:Uncharacterized protein n=1 Tax=Brachypodium distachyon TaxID=15368 RepID=A0A0Q3IBQ3_BRADI|nr:hypothetical protein BRADI_5g15523v3 [Brachypodium distachyon]
MKKRSGPGGAMVSNRRIEMYKVPDYELVRRDRMARNKQEMA